MNDKDGQFEPVPLKIFCDESCHLQYDKSNIMVLGAICCPESNVEVMIRKIKRLRYEHNYQTELKWTKLISRQMHFYEALIDLFCFESALSFKATVVMNKSVLNHGAFNQGSHNNFYYKMFYYTLRDFLSNGSQCKIYLDYMDTLGRDKARKLGEVLHGHAAGRVGVNCYTIRSYESQLIQLCDFFIGAISYSNREDISKESKVKGEVISYLENSLSQSLCEGTAAWEMKFNMFKFSPKGTSC